MFTSSLLLYVLLASQASVGTKDLEVKVVRVGIPTPAKDKLRLNVDIQLLPAKPLTLNRIVIHHLKANGIPIFTSPINEKLQMSSGLPVARSIPVWVNYRDLQSLEPMISAVDTNSMVVEGEVSLDVDVGLLASVVLLHRNVPARTKFRSTVPVDVPGGTIGKRALLAALRGTDRVRDLMSSRFSTKNRDWLNSLQAEYQDSWVLVGTVYQLKGKKGETQKFSVIRCGGFLNERQMLVTHESLEPWLYDPEAALLLASRKWKVDESSTDIWVWRTGELSTP